MNNGNKNVCIKKGKIENIETYLSIFNECKHDAYISHGEVFCGRATHDLKWAGNINSQMKQEFDGYFKEIDKYSVFEILLASDITGFAIIEMKRETRAAILQDIMIRRKYQGLGIGAEALHNIEEFLKNENIGIIMLESGINNKNVHKFFEKNGYTEISVEYSKRIT